MTPMAPPASYPRLDRFHQGIVPMRTAAVLAFSCCLVALCGCPQATNTTTTSSLSTAAGKPSGVPETSTGAPAGAASTDAKAAPGGASGIALSAENTKIEFVGSKANGRHTGGFKQLSGNASLTEDKKAPQKFSIEISIESMYTDNPMLTRHLLNADFFEATAYPKATFETTSIEAAADGDATHAITGDLTMHGATKSISAPATVSADGGKLKLTTRFTIDRREWGINYGQGMVNNDVEISVSIETP